MTTELPINPKLNIVTKITYLNENYTHTRTHVTALGLEALKQGWCEGRWGGRSGHCKLDSGL